MLLVAGIFVQIPPSLFKGMDDLDWPIPEAACATLYQCTVSCCAESDPPNQVHLSLSSSDSSLMGVSWVTLSDVTSVVEYGIKPLSLSSKNSGSTSTYVAAGWRGRIHKAVMTDLVPNTRYYYRVGNGLGHWSDIFNFKTLPEDPESVTYAIIG